MTGLAAAECTPGVPSVNATCELVYTREVCIVGLGLTHCGGVDFVGRGACLQGDQHTHQHQVECCVVVLATPSRTERVEGESACWHA